MANVDLKSLFTSEKQYTVLQLLNALIDETEKALIKSATIAQDVDKGALTVTITLGDDSTLTATTALKSLTDDEKSLISTLVTNVQTNTDGLTFIKFVGFEGNETHKGSEIHEGYVSFLGDEAHAGTSTYKGVIKIEEIDNRDGNGMVRNKSTEGAMVFGSSAKQAVIMGSGDRPMYSKDGSDFTGVELALKSDVPTGGGDLYLHNIRLTFSSLDSINVMFNVISSSSNTITTYSELSTIYSGFCPASGTFTNQDDDSYLLVGIYITNSNRIDYDYWTGTKLVNRYTSGITLTIQYDNVYKIA